MFQLLTKFSRVDKGLAFVPKYQELSPRKQRRQDLYSQDTLNRSAILLGQSNSPKKKKLEEYTESPDAKKQFVNFKRLKGNNN